MLLGIIIFVVVIPIKNRLHDVNKLATNFTPVQKDYSNFFPLTAKELVPVSMACSNIPKPANSDGKEEWNCQTNSEILFKSNITYYGTKTRDIYAGILVCTEDDENCCDKIRTNAIWEDNKINIIPEDTTTSNAVKYTFTETKSYKVYPVIECVFDAKTGCKTTGMDQSAVTCSDNEYILIHAK